MKKSVVRLIKIGLLLCGCLTIGFALMVLVYLIPTERIFEHAKSGVEELKKEDFSKHTDEEWCATIRDETTDAIMLSTAVFDSGENVLSAAMKNQRIEFENINAYDNLIKYYEIHNNVEGMAKNKESESVESEDKEEKTTEEDIIPYAYTRYWNGYLVVLKPLLYLFDYKVVNFINYVVIILLILMNMLMFVKLKKQWYIIPFCFMLFSINPLSIARCLQYVNILVITLITMLIMMIFNKELHDKNRYIYVFMLNGVCVAFFDLLTYPLVAVGVPLTLYFILEKENLKQGILNLIKYSLSWGTGYSLMWAGKWVIATIITKQNVIKNAMDTVEYRTGSRFNQLCDGVISDLDLNMEVGELSFSLEYKDTIIRNLFGYCYITVISIFIGLILLGIFFIFDKRKEISFSCVKNSIIFIIIALYPFIWYRVMINHSFGHFYYTSKIMCVTSFAILSMLVYICRDCDKKNSDNK